MPACHFSPVKRDRERCIGERTRGVCDTSIISVCDGKCMHVSVSTQITLVAVEQIDVDKNKTQAHEHFLIAGGAQDVRLAVVEVNATGLPEREEWVRNRVDCG